MISMANVVIVVQSVKLYSLAHLHSYDSYIYENTPTAIFHGCKNDNSKMIFFYYFHIFAQNIDCGYTLELPQ